jgi:hypothetical protein
MEDTNSRKENLIRRLENAETRFDNIRSRTKNAKIRFSKVNPNTVDFKDYENLMSLIEFCCSTAEQSHTLLEVQLKKNNV